MAKATITSNLHVNKKKKTKGLKTIKKSQPSTIE